jgi:hypothetical protein
VVSDIGKPIAAAALFGPVGLGVCAALKGLEVISEFRRKDRMDAMSGIVSLVSIIPGGGAAIKSALRIGTRVAAKEGFTAAAKAGTGKTLGLLRLAAHDKKEPLSIACRSAGELAGKHMPWVRSGYVRARELFTQGYEAATFNVSSRAVVSAARASSLALT